MNIYLLLICNQSQTLSELYSCTNNPSLSLHKISNDYSNTQEIGNSNEVESHLSQSESLRKQLEDSIKLSTSIVINHKQDVGLPSLNNKWLYLKQLGISRNT